MRIILNIAQGAAPLLAVLAAVLVPAPSPAADGPGAGLAVEEAFEPSPREAGPEHGKAFTGDATPLEPGRVEVELAYAPSWWATAGAVDRLSGEQHPLAAALSVGVVPDVDARIVVGWALLHAAPDAAGAPAHGAGLTDTTVSGRWRFLSLADPALDLAVSVGVTAPTGTRSTAGQLGTSRESWSVGGALLASADWGRLTAGAELGVSATVGPRLSNDVGLLTCNAAVGYQALPWLQPAVELNYQHEIELGEQPDERVLWATAALVVPLDAVRVVVGGRFPIWVRDAAVGPMATAAVKLGF
jgi:hypothetical protein